MVKNLDFRLLPFTLLHDRFQEAS